MSHFTDARSAEECTLVVLDASVFQELLESLGAPAAVAAVYRKFLGNAATFIRELASQDIPARIETMHTLKGSAAMLGAHRMSALAAQLQTELHGSLVQVEKATRDLEDELERFRVAAAQCLHGAGGELDP
jgi:HPt (histidine-containing phosphotransfer) domain-containing protein